MGKNILYINQYFKTPEEPGITRSYWISKKLIENGHNVTMISHRNVLHSHVKNKKQFIDTEIIDGIKVIYILNKYSNSMNMYQRSVSFLTFMFFSTVVSLFQKKIDITIATSTPLTVAIPALVLNITKRIPFVFEVRDLWPDVPIQMGAIKNKFVIFLLKKIEKITYKRAEKIITLSPGMNDGVVKYVNKSKTSIIPNMAKVDKFWPRKRNDSLFNTYNLNKSSFKLIYFGQMGLTNDIETILEAAKISQEKNKKSIEFIFVGHGKKFQKIQQYIDVNRMQNIKLLQRVPMNEISELVNLCDVSLVMFTNFSILGTNSPNKLFDSLSAGLALIVNSDGWTKNIVEDNKCGYYVKPTDALDLYNKIFFLSQNEKELNILKKNSRVLAENKYDKKILCGKFLQVFEKTIKNL